MSLGFEGRDTRRWAPYAFLSPFYLLFAIFCLFPVLFMIYLSFHIWNPAEGLGSMTWVGASNYKLALSDPQLWQSLWNTLLIALMSGIPQHLVALPTAYLLVKLGAKAQRWLSISYFMPFVSSTLAVSLIFYLMYSPTSGIINKTLLVLSEMSLTRWAFGWVPEAMPIRWIQDNYLIRYSISFVVFWKYVGFNILIYTAALMTIPKDVYAAARIDGANAWQQFWHIVLPMLRPFIFVAVTMTIIGNMNLFEESFVLTRGLEQATQGGMTISNYLYRVAWEHFDMGSAAAISWILFAIIALITYLYFHLFGHRGQDAH